MLKEYMMDMIKLEFVSGIRNLKKGKETEKIYFALPLGMINKVIK